MNSCLGVDLHLRNATLCHRVKGRERSLRTLELHSAEWHVVLEVHPNGHGCIRGDEPHYLVVRAVGGGAGPSRARHRSNPLARHGRRPAQDRPLRCPLVGGDGRQGCAERGVCDPAGNRAAA